VTVANNLSGIVKVKWEGDLASLETDASVNCGDVKGSIIAGGAIKCNDVSGSLMAGGSAKCNYAGGSIQAGGSVKIG
jgi:hypothetical protein